MEEVESIKPRCDICDKPFKNMAGLSGHLRFSHQTTLDEVNEAAQESANTDLTKKKAFRIKTIKPIGLDAQILAIAEQLVNDGLANNLTDLMRKALITYGGINKINLLSGGRMDKETIEMLKDNGNPLSAAMAYKILNDSGKNNGNGSDMMTMMLMNQMMTKNDKSNNDIMPIMMMMMMSQKQHSNGMESLLPVLMAGRQEKQSIDPTLLIALSQSKGSDMKDILGVMTALSKRDNISDVLGTIEKIRADREDKVESLRTENQKMMYDILQKELSELRNAVAGELEGSGIKKQLREKVDQLLINKFDSAVKDVSGEQSSADKAMGLIKDVAKEIKEPILKPLGQAMADTFANQQVPQQQLPVQHMSQPQKPPAKNIADDSDSTYMDNYTESADD